MHSAANYSILDSALHQNRSCGFPPENSFHIFRPADDPNFPWPGMVFGLTVMALNAWCFDQVSTSSEFKDDFGDVIYSENKWDKRTKRRKRQAEMSIHEVQFILIVGWNVAAIQRVVSQKFRINNWAKGGEFVLLNGN